MMATFAINITENVISVQVGENTVAALASAVRAEDAAASAEASVVAAVAATGPFYLTTAAGLAATTSGEEFTVRPNVNDTTADVFLNVAGTAVFSRTIILAPSAPTAAAEIGIDDGASGALFDTIQDSIDYLLIDGPDVVRPERFGAVALEDGGTTSQSATILAALSSGRIVDGGGKTYVIGASVNPADNTVTALRNCNFVRLAANQTTQDTMIDLTGQPGVKVRGCSFDFGTTEDAGSNDDSSRILLAVGSNNSDPATWISGIEVTGCSFTGGGNGTPIFVRGTVGVRILNNTVSDRVVGGTPTNDAQNGIDITHSLDALVEGNRVDGLYTRVAGVLTRIYSRGILVTNSQNIRVIGNTVANCDQCIDFSGAISASTPNGNDGFVVANNICHDYRTWGIKFANCVRNGVCEGNTIRNFGFGGIVASGQSSAWPGGTAAQATQNLTIEGNYIYNPTTINSEDCYGIWFTYTATYPGYPVNCRILNNTIRNTTGNNRLVHGILLSDGDRNIVAGAPVQEVRGNKISGQTGTPTKGCVPDGVCVLTADSNQSIANATWVPVDWDTETIDSQGMHSTSSNTELIVPNGAGWYLVTATIAFSANATGIRAIRILVSGNTAQGGHAQVAASNNADALNSVSVSCVVYMSATDNVKVEAYQNSSGALNVLRINSQFSARRIEQMGAV
jgi:hypothetical protein